MADQRSLKAQQELVCGRCLVTEERLASLESQLKTATEATYDLQDELSQSKGDLSLLMSTIQVTITQVGGAGGGAKMHYMRIHM